VLQSIKIPNLTTQGSGAVEKTDGSQGFVAIFLLMVTLLGALTGAGVGYGLDGVLHGRRLLALLAAFSAVAVVSVLRVVLGRSSPLLFLAPPGAKIPLQVWLSVCLSTLIGALAGHDLTQLFDVPYGAIVGLFSGGLASISMATLMIVYFHEHPERGVEF
jgi:hypothetical protein